MTPSSREPRRSTTTPRRSAQKLTSTQRASKHPNYTRRRLAALGVLLSAAALFVLGGMWLYGVAHEALEAQTLEDSSTGPTYFTGQPQACEPDVLTWTWQASGAAAGSSVTFDYTVTNGGDVPCVVDASGGSLVVTVTSGDDRVYSTADCSDDDAFPLLLGIGDSTQRTITWTGQRTEPACEEAGGTAGAGTYVMSVTYGGVEITEGRQVFYLY